jgi:hypothetical protein
MSILDIVPAASFVVCVIGLFFLFNRSKRPKS